MSSPPRAPVACVVGSGAREHALAVVLGRSADVVVTPGNPGIQGRTAEGHHLSSSAAPPEEIEADLVVIGPEGPLVDGLADRLRSRGTTVFGPGADGARIEGSKAFMKQLCSTAGVPTAAWGAFEEIGAAAAFLRSMPGPYVVKTDGLAGGKGVLVTEDLAEAEADAAAKLSGTSFGEAGRRIVLEEGLSGQELSLLCICDGHRAVPLLPARDFKRLGDGDTGPNTGGMGAFAPVPGAGDELVGTVMDEIVEPSLRALSHQGIDYRGVLYAGLMLTDDGPKLVEYNARFGDPEAEVVLPLYAGDLFELLHGAASGSIPGPRPPGPAGAGDAAVCVVAAGAGYPGQPAIGSPISGLEEAGSLPGVTVFHAGTDLDKEGTLVVAGGRVVCVSALGTDLGAARTRAYGAIAMVSFEGMQHRSDVALVESTPGPGCHAGPETGPDAASGRAWP